MSKHFKVKLAFAAFILLAVLVFPVHAASEAPQMQWEKTYGYVAGNDAVQTFDGGYAIAGSTADYRGSYVAYENNSAMLMKTDAAGNLSLTFTFTGKAAWLGYSLDSQMPVQVTQNTTLSGLTNETHNLTAYATDTVGNTVFETVNFTIEEPFPTGLLVLAIVLAAAVSISLIVYFARTRKKAQQ